MQVTSDDENCRMRIRINALTVSCMHYAMGNGKNAFIYPETEDVNDYSNDVVLCTFTSPVPVNRRFLSLFEEDFNKANAGFKKKVIA